MICRKCSRDLPDGAVFCCWCGVKQEITRTKKTASNGEGSIYRRADRPGWTVAWTLGTTLSDGKVKQQRKTKSGFKTKKDAALYLAELRTGKEALNVKVVPTVSELYDQYKDRPGKKQSANTLSAYKTAYNKRIKDSFGWKPVDVVTVHDLEAAVAGLNYDPAKDVKDLMSLLFKRAMADGFIQTNPAVLMALPERKSAEIPAWDKKEVEALWKAWGEGDRIAASCLLMIHTGMMPGELFTLKKDMIEWDANRIVGCGLKTSTRKDTPIVFPEVVAPVLRDLCDTSVSQQGYVMGINRDKYYEEFKKMKTALEIRPEVRPYSSRHSTATELELLGVSPTVIAQVLRHKTYATTAKHYIEIDTQKALEAVNKISKKEKEGAQ